MPAPAADARETPLSLRREALGIAAILLVALTLRLTFTYQVHTGQLKDPLSKLTQGTDMEKHDGIARWILANGWYEKSADVSPLYPYVVLPLLYKATGSNPFLAEMIQGVFDALTVLLVYLIARRLYGTRAAAYAGLGAAVYAPFVVYQGQLLSESLLNILIAAFFLVMLGVSGRRKTFRAVAAGLLLGLAVAAKPTCFVFAPLTVLLVWKENGWKVRPSIAPVIVAAAACVAVLLPFAYRNYRAVGEFHLVRGNSGIMLYMGNNPEATGAYKQPTGPEAYSLAVEAYGLNVGQRDRLYTAAALRFIWNNPRRFLRLTWNKFLMFFDAREISNNLSVKLYRQTTFLRVNTFATFGLVMPLAAAGFFLSLRRRGVWFVAAQAAIYSAAIILFVVVGRYRLAVVPLLLPAAGFAVSELMLALKSLDLGRTAAVALPTAALAAAVNWFSLSTTVNQRLHPAGFAQKAAGRVIVHDDSDYATPFGAFTLYQSTEIVKFLVVTGPLTGLRGATVMIQAATDRPGVITVTLNDSAQKVNMRVSPKQWIMVPFPPQAVQSGTNGIYLQGDGKVSTFVYADDVYNFGRSLYSPSGSDRLSDDFDQLSYRRHPELHIGGHEFKIRLLLDYGKDASPPVPSGATAAPPAGT